MSCLDMAMFASLGILWNSGVVLCTMISMVVLFGKKAPCNETLAFVEQDVFQYVQMYSFVGVFPKCPVSI